MTFALERYAHPIHELPSGRRIELRSEPEEALTVTSPSGRIELTVRFTDGGLKLCFEGADVDLRATETLTLSAREVDIQAAERASLRGAAVAVEASKGNLDLTANDFVNAEGEQIRLNCDREDDVPAWLEELVHAQLARGPRER